MPHNSQQYQALAEKALAKRAAFADEDPQREQFWAEAQTWASLAVSQAITESSVYLHNIETALHGVNGSISNIK
jgi:hypothetical protein